MQARESIQGKKVAVVGLGERTGVSLVKYLCSLGALVTVFDEKREADLSDALSKLTQFSFDLKAGKNKAIDGFELILLSPGIPINHPILERAKAKEIPILSEVEFASCRISAPVIAITGTNGKSTATALVAHILKAWGKSTFAGGNLGTPLIEAVNQKWDFVVVEISSFQLEAVETFHPKVGMLLNLSPNHLDRHGTMENYAALKATLFARMTEEDVAVLNAEDEYCRKIARKIKARLVYFGSEASDIAEVKFSGSELRAPSGVISLKNFKPLGRHNLENAAASTAAALACGCPLRVLENALSSFEGLPHRLEFVREKNGVRFYNDSKSTTPAATVRAVEAFDRPVVLLAGGKPKGASYEELSKIKKRIKKAVLFGPAAKSMATLFSKADIMMAPNLQSAVEQGLGAAVAGDVVLLSPGNSSFDEFKNFEERGEKFKGWVHAA